MARSDYKHEFNVGDAVLVRMGPGVDIPGIIEDEDGNRFQVALAEPWADESGRKSDEVWAGPDQLEVFIEESGGRHALQS